MALSRVRRSNSGATMWWVPRVFATIPLTKTSHLRSPQRLRLISPREPLREHRGAHETRRFCDPSCGPAPFRVADTNDIAVRWALSPRRGLEDPERRVDRPTAVV